MISNFHPNNQFSTINSPEQPVEQSATAAKDVRSDKVAARLSACFLCAASHRTVTRAVWATLMDCTVSNILITAPRARLS